jgi:hypothetical protein
VPLFLLFTVICTKAWVDGLLGRSYSWVRTARSSWSAIDGAEPGVATVPAQRTPEGVRV